MLTVALRFKPPDNHHQPTQETDDTINVFPSPQNYVTINNEFNLYFNHVLGHGAAQSEVFAVVKPHVDDFLSGNNCCMLTYGAKSAGKSYTMFGRLDDKKAVAELGLLPRTVSYIIERLQSFYSADSGQDAMDWNLFISFGNVYNDTIYDLVDPGNTKHIHLKKNKKTDEYYVKHLTQIKIKRISSFLKHLHLAHAHAHAHRQRQPPSDHDSSSPVSSPRNRSESSDCSRCHMFASVKLNVYSVYDTQRTKISATTFNFIDCASYPRIHQHNISSAARQDAQHLNYSFIQLNALMTRMAKQSDLQIDERESVLTKLLFPIRQRMASSNHAHKLLVLINCTLETSLRAETMATLRFGNLPTVDPFILGMMEKQRLRIQQLDARCKEHKLKIKCYKQQETRPKPQTQHKPKQLQQLGSVDDESELTDIDDRSNHNETTSLRMQHAERSVTRARADNEQLAKEKAASDRARFQLQNEFDQLHSTHELLQLDCASLQQELSAQKNRFFWLSEDYNELQHKFDKLQQQQHQESSSTFGVNGDQLQHLLQELRQLRETHQQQEEWLQRANEKCAAYELQIAEHERDFENVQTAHTQHSDELLAGIKERDEQLRELRREMHTKEEQFLREQQNARDEHDADVRWTQQLQQLLSANGITFELTSAAAADSNSNSNSSDQRVRALQMELMKYKTDIAASATVQKLRDAKQKLEQKVIELRTQNARQMVTFTQQQHAIRLEMTQGTQKLRNASAIRKWVRLVHQQQLLSVARDIERAKSKMKENYSQNNEFREQMHVLRKIAEQKCEHALQHQTQIVTAATSAVAAVASSSAAAVGQYQRASPALHAEQSNVRKALMLSPYASLTSPAATVHTDELDSVEDREREAAAVAAAGASSLTLPPQLLQVPRHVSPVSSVSVSSTPPQKHRHLSYENLAIESMSDFEQHMVGLLPENLKRIHQVIDQLTSKLMHKNGQLQEVRAQFESLLRAHKKLEEHATATLDMHMLHVDSSEKTSKGTKSIPSTPDIPNTDSNNEDEDGGGGGSGAMLLKQYTRDTASTGHSSFEEYLPAVLDRLNGSSAGSRSGGPELPSNHQHNGQSNPRPYARKLPSVEVAKFKKPKSLGAAAATNGGGTPAYMLLTNEMAITRSPSLRGSSGGGKSADDLLVFGMPDSALDDEDEDDDDDELVRRPHSQRYRDRQHRAHFAVDTDVETDDDDGDAKSQFAFLQFENKRTLSRTSSTYNDLMDDDNAHETMQTPDSLLPPQRTGMKISQSFTRSAKAKKFNLRARSHTNGVEATTTTDMSLGVGLPRQKSAFSGLVAPRSTSIRERLHEFEQHDATNRQRQQQQRELQRPLSITFHIDSRKNTRIQLNVATTPKAVYQSMCNGLISDDRRDERFSLVVQANASPAMDKIVIPFEHASMSFWQLIVEFGVMNLLHFNICCDGNAASQLDAAMIGNQLKNGGKPNSYAPKLKPKPKKTKSKKPIHRTTSASLLGLFAKK